MKVLYIEARSKRTVPLARLSEVKEKRIGLITTVQHLSQLERVKKQLEKYGKEVFLGKQKNNESKSFLSYTLNLFGFYKEKKKLIYEKITPKFFGSAPLLGVNGTVLVGHGMCTERDVMNSVDLAYKLYQDKFLRRLMVSVKKLQKK